ncbi:MAG: lamin tail domain-containing protein [Paludibacter sp.]|nr:lamin tail domain-containing protein [Bacteroidales bacterium]MCM1068605.1 lamin tail domain-containing protein [Prevotella sp.]MCM1353269.1 lamin tail domain-containing protein [Bacteroides sp.]MCM1442323.1 lamin tail domain-containing protein [Muribaculum sp.]MCM1481142.1 lamin tail domain-containing protein [Paludibacter sp.]
MRRCKWITLFLGLLLEVVSPICAQFMEDFSDADYIANPAWVGTYEHFAVNPWQQLQTKAPAASFSWLATSCRVNHNAEWTFWCRIATTPSANNWIRFYLLSDTDNPQQGNGWFVQIGGADKNITLCRQNAGNTDVVIVNTLRKQMLKVEDNKIQVRITLDENGIFRLFSWVIGVDSDYVFEGEYRTSYVGEGEWCSILVRNTAKTGDCFYIDDITVAGEFLQPTEIYLPEQGDLVINEIMYNPADGGQEYVEIYNRTHLCLQLSDVGITTRNTEGQLQKPNLFPPFSYINPYGYAVLCANADSLSAFHHCPDSVCLYTCTWSRKLPNAGAVLVLMDMPDAEILDSIEYSPAWHHPLLNDTKGVALERIHPDLVSNKVASWHSASSSCGFATPGLRNSQYIDIYTDENEESGNFIWLEQSYFSPNGDGFEDVCRLAYSLPSVGFMANITVYTPKGLCVYRWLTNELLSTEGVLLWDGRIDAGKVAQVGIYVLMCEFTNASTGQILRRKLSVVVADR